MGNHYTFNRPIVIEEGIDGGLSVYCIPTIRLDAGQVGVFHVDKMEKYEKERKNKTLGDALTSDTSIARTDAIVA